MDVIIDLDALSQCRDWLTAKSRENLLVPLEDLLTPAFMAEHTRFADLPSLLQSAGLVCVSAEQWRVNLPALDAFLAASTCFRSLSELLVHAAAPFLPGI